MEREIKHTEGKCAEIERGKITDNAFDDYVRVRSLNTFYGEKGHIRARWDMLEEKLGGMDLLADTI